MDSLTCKLGTCATNRRTPSTKPNEPAIERGTILEKEARRVPPTGLLEGVPLERLGTTVGLPGARGGLSYFSVLVVARGCIKQHSCRLTRFVGRDASRPIALPARGLTCPNTVPGCRLLGPSFFHTITSVPPALAARLPPFRPSSPTNHRPAQMDEKTPKDRDRAGPREYLNGPGRYSTVVSALWV